MGFNASLRNTINEEYNDQELESSSCAHSASKKVTTNMAKFDLVFSRANNEVLAEMFGGTLLGLINSLSQKGRHQAIDRDALLATFSPASILLNKARRSVLMSLLREEEAAQILSSIGISPPDGTSAYDLLQALGISARQLKKVFEFFQVPYPEDEAIIPKPSIEQVAPDYGLFEHQRTAVREVLKLISGPPQRVILHMPTGAGKTRTAMNIIAHYLRETEPITVLWLANSEELCEQATSEFIKCWKNLGNREVAVQRYWGSHNELAQRDGLIVAGFQKIYNTFVNSPAEFARFGECVKLIIVDEAHQVVAPTYQEVVNAINSRNLDTPLIGLTATPGRTWNEIDSDEALSDFFCRKKVTLKVKGYDNPVEYLIAEGYLSRPTFHELPLNSFDEDEIKRIYEEFEIPDNLLRKLAADELRTLKIIKRIEDLVQRHKRILVFATTVEHSDILAVLLKMKGYNAKSVSSKSTADSRKSTIDWFKDDSSEHKILCNFGILTTGFDAPQTSAAVIARPTKSLVLFSQMVGRATRGIKAKGNKESEIVTVVDIDLPGFRSLSDSFTNWEDIWE